MTISLTFCTILSNSIFEFTSFFLYANFSPDDTETVYPHKMRRCIAMHDVKSESMI